MQRRKDREEQSINLWGTVTVLLINASGNNVGLFDLILWSQYQRSTRSTQLNKCIIGLFCWDALKWEWRPLVLVCLWSMAAGVPQYEEEKKKRSRQWLGVKNTLEPCISIALYICTFTTLNLWEHRFYWTVITDVSVSMMTVCLLCKVQAAHHDVELLLPSITASVAVGKPFPVHSSPLPQQSGCRKRTTPRLGQIYPPPPPSPPPSLPHLSPTAPPSPSLYRELWSIGGESWSGLQIKAITLAVEKEIRTQACPPKTDTHPSLLPPSAHT